MTIINNTTVYQRSYKSRYSLLFEETILSYIQDINYAEKALH